MRSTDRIQRGLAERIWSDCRMRRLRRICRDREGSLRGRAREPTSRSAPKRSRMRKGRLSEKQIQTRRSTWTTILMTLSTMLTMRLMMWRWKVRILM